MKVVDHFKFFSPHAITIMLKSSLGILSLLLFIRLTLSISSTGSVQSFDEGILKWVEALRTSFLNLMMLDITTLGG